MSGIDARSKATESNNHKIVIDVSYVIFLLPFNITRRDLYKDTEILDFSIDCYYYI